MVKIGPIFLKMIDNAMFLKLATLGLIPALIIQGRRVKKNTLRLAEPEGEREGTSGQGQALSILILGDSAAAGVGVSHQEDALLGAILAGLTSEFQVSWELHAKTGNTTGQVIQSVQQLDTEKFDVVVTSVGVNDITKLMPAHIWIQKQAQLYQLIADKFQPQLILAAGVPPMQLFPALPNPLAWLFGQYAKQMNRELHKFIQKQPNMDWIEYDIAQYQQMQLEMAEDGFHPSKEIYQIWGKEVTLKIKQRLKMNKVN